MVRVAAFLARFFRIAFQVGIAKLRCSSSGHLCAIPLGLAESAGVPNLATSPNIRAALPERPPSRVETLRYAQVKVTWMVVCACDLHGNSANDCPSRSLREGSVVFKTTFSANPVLAINCVFKSSYEQIAATVCAAKGYGHEFT